LIKYISLELNRCFVESMNRVDANMNSTISIFKSIFTFLMVSSLIIATTGFFETYIGYLLLDVRPNVMVCFAVFLMTFSIYSLDKITDSNEDSINMPERQRFLPGRKRYILYYSLAAYALSALITLLDKPLALPIIFIPLAANAVYGSRIIPDAPRLKDVPVVKNLVVAISWALVTTLLPAMNMAEKSSLVIASVFYFMLAKVFINAVLYDIRDIKGDKEMGIRTMPVLLGSRKTTAILLGINGTILPCIAHISDLLKPLAVMMVLYGFLYIIYFGETRSALSLDLLVDGQWMISTFLFWLA
jgi:4-hydroxybenzoate polyprenyltransferase